MFGHHYQQQNEQLAYPVNLPRETLTNLALSRGNPSTTFPSPAGSPNIYFPSRG